MSPGNVSLYIFFYWALERLRHIERPRARESAPDWEPRGSSEHPAALPRRRGALQVAAAVHRSELAPAHPPGGVGGFHFPPMSGQGTASRAERLGPERRQKRFPGPPHARESKALTGVPAREPA